MWMTLDNNVLRTLKRNMSHKQDINTSEPNWKTAFNLFFCSSSASADSYVSTLSCPEPSCLIKEMTKCRWTGLITSDRIQTLIQAARSDTVIITYWVISNKLHHKKVVHRWAVDGRPTTYWPPTDHLPTNHQPPTTYRPSTDHIPTTYWPPTNHLPTTYQPTTNHLPTIYRPHTDHLPTTYQPLPTTYQPTTDHLPTIYRLPTDHLLTTYRPPTNHYQPPTNQPPTTYRPSTDHLPTTYRPPTDHLPTNQLPTAFLQCSLFSILK